MKLREITAEDFAQLEALHTQQNFDYPFPDLGAREFFLKLAVTDDENSPRLTICARRTCELFMLSDAAWLTPGLRFTALQKIHEATRQELERLGYSDVHIWLPPEVERSFSRRLIRDFAWSRSRWMNLARGTGKAT